MIGHAFTSRTLIEEQNDATEKALWIALRTSLAKTHEERAQETLEHSALIRDLIRDLRTISEFPIENREAS